MKGSQQKHDPSYLEPECPHHCLTMHLFFFLYLFSRKYTIYKTDLINIIAFSSTELNIKDLDGNRPADLSFEPPWR